MANKLILYVGTKAFCDVFSLYRFKDFLAPKDNNDLVKGLSKSTVIFTSVRHPFERLVSGYK